MEGNRRLADDVLTTLADAGIFRMRVPVRYGGCESDMRTVSTVVSELYGRALCGLQPDTHYL